MLKHSNSLAIRTPIIHGEERQTVKDFQKTNKNFSLEDYMQYIDSVIEKNKNEIKSLGYSDVVDRYLATKLNDLAVRFGINNGSIEAYVSNHKNELRIGGDGKIYPIKSFYIKNIIPRIQQIKKTS